MTQIKIFDTVRALESALGALGARQQLVIALRSGAAIATCATFHAVNPRAYCIVPYPDSAQNYEIPPDFWHPSTWALEGEQPLSADRRGNRWSTCASWENGEFSISGSHCRGRLPVMRRAVGVTLSLADARGLLAKYGVSAKSLVAGERMSAEEATAWHLAWIKERMEGGLPSGYNYAEPAFLKANPRNGRTVSLPSYKAAREILKR